jgi:hypothetical protein
MQKKKRARITIAAMCFIVGATLLNGQTVIKSDWPKDKIPADISVYPYAGVTDHGPSSDNYWIKIADGKAADLAKYVALMTTKGWIHETKGSFDYLKKGDESIELRLFPQDNIAMLIISVFKPPRNWPTKNFPELPEPKKGTYTFNTDPNSGTTITIGRITQADLVDYFKILVSTGWKGVPDELQLSRSSPRKLVIIAAENGENEWSLSISNE